MIKTGIDLDKFPFIERNPPIYNQKTTFISVGRLIPKEGMDVLIRAFAKVHRKYPQTNLVIIGEGEMHNQLEKLIKRKDLMPLTLVSKISVMNNNVIYPLLFNQHIT